MTEVHAGRRPGHDRVAHPSASGEARHGVADRRQLIWFAAVCTLITLGFFVGAGLTGGSATTWPTLLLFGLGASGPSLAALAMRVFGGRRQGVPLRPVAPWLWFPAAIVLGALPALLASFLLGPSGFGQRIAESVTIQAAANGGPLVFVILYLIAGPLSEEFGWRGYVQPRLRRAFSPLTTSVVLGVAWAIWHVPFFLIEGTGQSKMGLITVQAAIYFVTMIPLAAVYLYVSERLRGGVWAAITIHLAGNVALTLAPAPSVAASALILAIVTVLAGILLRLQQTRVRAA